MEDKKANIIGATVIIGLIVFIIVARVSLKLSGLSSSLQGQILHFLRKVAGVPIKFKHKELEDATDNFRALLGKGSSASVFKGILGDGTSVAVKRIDGEEFLVYEFIPNGSLDHWIFPRRERETRNYPGGCLAWDLTELLLMWLRHCFLDGVAAHASICQRSSSTNVMETDCREHVVAELDCCVVFDVNAYSAPNMGFEGLKNMKTAAFDVNAYSTANLCLDQQHGLKNMESDPENILLDENYRAIVADFDLSKLMGKYESRVITTIRGTRGYLAPEWLLEHGVSEKSDIYSYGMVLLKMIGGQRNVNFIGNGTDRPSMAQVAEMLEGRVVVEEPPDKQMVVVDLLSTDEEDCDYHQRSKLTVMGLDADRNIPNSASRTIAPSYVLSKLNSALVFPFLFFFIFRIGK
ncbi:hypothetical protein F3Y22_tig00109987pilonHSYRG00013 [Hibiscus syriacus]|uniref:Protein kinase domain-containing protein n=1 Tax=Hibiscus syriacus TaxID=106335 RepID=A0A6A3BQV4_HIBSY|nr:hypothetical protein F3Y22_tig00109987pilonHSYRG00013 [Hibiscus syriacus]